MTTMSLSWLINFLCWVPLIYGVESCEHQGVQELIKTSPVILKALGARIFADISADEVTKDNATSLITLTPETLYKGASILKVTQTADSGEYFEYEGQLNATLEPLVCFDNDILSLLPTQLIAFGKLDSYQPDLLRVSINGLHKWSPQFESHIWKYLGWDDWSDFTPCSVTCGKGVQQRFRRCLLDSPDRGAALSMGGILDSSSGGDGDGEGDTRNTNSRQQSMNLPYEGYHHHPRLEINGKSNNRNHKKYSTSNKMKKRRKKKGKGLSTLSCEGYNIEQRNCNMFECRDDISDLLKFHKKSFLFNETTSNLGTTTTMAGTTVGSLSSSSSSSPSSSTSSSSSSSSSTSTTAPITTTSGILLGGWKNPMNFTLMTTLKAKNKIQSTIFSLRNETHNLYLEQSLDGLKLFQERDGATEMLPIKLDLYDNRWHQIAISVHNGDFITIYVDCLWTNSFVVSKGLYSLPDGADIEVGRGFDGELLQLLILPGNYDKLQCSTVRTSINEVKRYIIDTFIEDDSN